VSLLVGAGLSQSANADVVADARELEALGFDFLSITDHLPGRRPSLETWTQLTWVAARTERIRVATNVLGLPYRPPAVLAKMTETLDRLSGGRLILGLGAGGSNAEFAALGLPVRSPGEKIDALEEALAIIRGLWTEPVFTYEGRFYQVRDAEIEPKPERPIPIWLGTYGKRALALTGREADGWLPSMFFAPPERMVEMRDVVRKAAEEAGRDPDDITYAYNVGVQVGDDLRSDQRTISGGPAEVTERLRDLVDRLGLTALSLWIRGAEQRRRFAAEVLLALRA
jgi:probable F420-dependent oxidoreductase